jgi:hypothetical protein
VHVLLLRVCFVLCCHSSLDRRTGVFVLIGSICTLFSW